MFLTLYPLSFLTFFSIQNRPSLWEKEEIVLPPSKTYSEEGENEVTTEWE